MTSNLKKAIEAANQLPADKQENLAEIILDFIENEPETDLLWAKHHIIEGIDDLNKGQKTATSEVTKRLEKELGL